MVTGIDAHKSYLLDKERVRASLSNLNNHLNRVETSDVFDILIAEGAEDLYNYLKWLGLANDSNLIVLSSQHHYYYEEDDLINVRTVVNLKPLNQIRNLGASLNPPYCLSY